MLITVVAGGDPIPPGVAAHLLPGRMVVAADSGADHALAIGLRPDIVVGDLDSIGADTLDIVRADAEVLAYPADKDATDLELAIGVALERGATALQIVGGHGGRIDHLLGNVGLVEALGVPVTWWAGNDRLELMVGGLRTVRTRRGAVLSVLAASPVAEISLSGTRWTLSSERIERGSTRGVSNVAESDTIDVTVHDGRIVMVFPDHISPDGISSDGMTDF